MNDARMEVLKIRTMENNMIKYQNVTLADIDYEKDILHIEMEDGVKELNDAFIVSYISLFYPIKMMLYTYFLKATKRTTNFITDFTHLIELCLFIAELIWIFDYYKLSVYDSTNLWAEDGDEGEHKNLMINVIWY